PFSLYFSIQRAMSGKDSLQMPQLIAQKCTTTTCPFRLSVSIGSELNQSVPPSREGMGLSIRSGIAISLWHFQRPFDQERGCTLPDPDPPGLTWRIWVETLGHGRRHVSVIPAPVLDLEGLLTGLPVGAAEAASLQGFEHTQSFVDATADVERVNDLILKRAVRIDDEQTAQSDGFVFEHNTVIAA